MKNINFEDAITPSHYHKNEIDVHGYLQKHFPKEGGYTVAEGFHIGNVIKYVSRYKQKNGLEDLLKAEANLKVLIELEGKENDKI
ncbi:DUF3310 domain-containing protein [Bacillus sp. JJ1474]|uniref:DUF3310 domain-containing protein n=1 Tax=Bacillus sp. JJ1474 TaxID=3122955 RepID=UPI0030006E83